MPGLNVENERSMYAQSNEDDNMEVACGLVGIADSCYYCVQS